jgi:succinoglycan biosynthesis protein ExoA
MIQSSPHPTAKASSSPGAVCTAVVTAVIPIRNEAAFIARTLDQVLDQDLTGVELEVIVVDGESTDGTQEIVNRYVDRDQRIQLINNPQRLSSAARNLAIGIATGDYIVVIDGHCEIPSRRYFIDLVDAFESSGADCLGRPQPLDVTDATPLQRAIALARSSRLGHHPESFIYSDQPQFVPAKSVAVAYRRQVFETVGVFDPSFDAHEDGEFNYRCDQAGLRCYFEPSLAVRYFPRSSLAGLFRQMFRYGRGRVRFSRKHAGTWNLGTLLPSLLVLYLLLGVLLIGMTNPLTIAYFVGLCVYIVAIVWIALMIAIQSRELVHVLYIPVIAIVIHIACGFGVLREAIRSGNSHSFK